MATSSPSCIVSSGTFISFEVRSRSTYSRLTVTAQLFSTLALTPGYLDSSAPNSLESSNGAGICSHDFLVNVAAVAKYRRVKCPARGFRDIFVDGRATD